MKKYTPERAAKLARRDELQKQLTSLLQAILEHKNNRVYGVADPEDSGQWPASTAMSEQHPGKEALNAIITEMGAGVTRGPWNVVVNEQFWIFEPSFIGECLADARHMARCDPDTMRAIASYVSDLQSRLEKAEAERDGLVKQQRAACEDMLATRNDILAGAQSYLRLQPSFGDGEWAAKHLDALKSPPPTPDQGDEA